MTTTVIEPLTYNMRTAAQRLNVSYEWLKKQVAADKVRHLRYGRAVRFTDEHLDEIIRAHERRPARPKSTARTKL